MKNINNSIMILAAGRGKRMLSYTSDTPKPLIKVANKSILLRIIEQFKDTNIKNFIINASYLSEKIYEFSSANNILNKNKILVSYEKDRLETGGGIKEALRLLPKNNFLSVNGDSLVINGKSGHPLKKLTNYINVKNMDALLLLAPLNKCIGYQGKGDFSLDSNKTPYIVSRNNNSLKSFVYTGWQVINPSAFSKINKKSFSMNLFYDNAIKSKRLYGIIHDGFYLHISTPDSLSQAEKFFLEKKLL